MTESTIEEYLPAPGEGFADLYVRETAPTAGHSRQRDCFERLSRLKTSGHLDAITVRVWGDSICTSAPEMSGLSEILEAITEIYTFSSRHSLSVAPFFRVERVNASIPNETFERIVPPHRTLVFSDEDGIVGVFPCRLGEQTYSPFDAIEQLETTAEIESQEPEEVDVTPHR